jgi:hypothetical protein
VLAAAAAAAAAAKSVLVLEKWTTGMNDGSTALGGSVCPSGVRVSLSVSNYLLSLHSFSGCSLPFSL